MSFFKWRRLGYGFLFAAGALLFAAATALLFGLFLMLLWNWLMPGLFGLSTITYWQSWGIILMSHLIFKGGHGHGKPHRFYGHGEGPCRGERGKKDEFHREFHRRMRHHFEERREPEKEKE